ncbi:ATP-binding protein [Pseudoalteromonas fenneropenaei]|uniref:histidine kinase n=1 Tax=Pseudoalteromonas fenneropenaei TaxID=1737459 RepID=A0ABV7CI60_9GAMM
MILVANTLVVLAIFIANQLAFQRSFSQYVQSTTRADLVPVIEVFVKQLKESVNWNWIRPGTKDFENIVNIYQLGEKHPTKPLERERPRRLNEQGQLAEQRPRDGRRPPPPPEDQPLRPRAAGLAPPNDGGDRRRGTSRLMFKTVQGDLILGTPRMATSALWIPLHEGDDNPETQGQGAILGYLGIENGSRLNAKFDEMFAKEQQRQFTYITAIVLVISFLLAIPSSKYLVKPILAIRRNAKQLASGNYDVKLKPKGNDEIGQLAKDINRLADTLADNRKAQRQWIADISHELRTPIAVIRAELEGMMDGVIDLDVQAIDSLHDEMCRLTRLVDDLHQLTLADRGALTYSMAPISLTEVVRKVLDKHAAMLEQRHFQVLLQAPSAGQIYGDAQRLTQLFDNLMQNTLRYTDSSPEQAGHIVIQISEQNDEVILLWQDSAPGVDEQKLPKLFERLYRVDQARSRAHGGSGLGLAICTSIVLAHQGSIDALASELGGLAVKISLAKE